MTEMESCIANIGLQLQNGAEAIPLDKNAVILHEETAVNMLLDKKIPNFVMGIVIA